MRLIIKLQKVFKRIQYQHIYYTTLYKPVSNFFLSFAQILIVTCYNVGSIMQNFSFKIKEKSRTLFFQLSGRFRSVFGVLIVYDPFYDFLSRFKQVMQVQIAEQ